MQNQLMQAEIPKSAAAKSAGRARVLKGEIEADAGRGGNTESKYQELAGIEQRAEEASSAAIKSLGHAVEAAKNASEEETEVSSGEEAKETSEEKTEESSNENKED